ncbi:MAG TPA: carbohydrate porin [Rhizomicrobium sp.]|nr:carbohydrate porin [Rhizomicrobium sp.]
MAIFRSLLPVPLIVSSMSTVALGSDDASEDWALHAQVTHVWQYHPAFHSPYEGTNSLGSRSVGDETFDLTGYAGVRLWDGGEAWINPEVDQGFGLSDTLGVAGFPSGEAYKVGKSTPYFRLQRLFFRQTIGLGGDSANVDADLNQLGGTRDTDNLVITAGKFSVTDIFDTNAYAHDSRGDFLNWSIIDSGAFDYAADAWGYSYGITGEWTQSWRTLRAGLFDLSRVPNSTKLERGFGQFEADAEIEARYPAFGQTGKIKLLGFVNRGRMGSYDDAVELANLTGTIPDTSLVRRYRSRPGVVLNVEQPLGDGFGAFLRASLNDGSKEAYEFTEINNSVALGLSVSGKRWGRGDDTAGIAGVSNGMSKSAQRYFANGGLGILIGDGQLPHYEREQILEAYYSAALTNHLSLSTDYQFIANPAYNRDRGPVSVLGARLHAQI